MPKVSEAHLAARREQIIDAAMRRFVENGFQATGMADVIAETGMSAGAVYRYFKSKDELIEAIVDRVLGHVAERFTELLRAESVPDPAAAVRAGVEAFEAMVADASVDVGRLAIQAWAEALRNDRIAATVTHAYSTIRGYYVEVSRRAIDGGTAPADADAGELGSALYSLMAGFVLQRVLIGGVDTESYSRGVSGLLDGRLRH